MSTRGSLIQEAVIPFLDDAELAYKRDEDRVTLDVVHKPCKYKVEVIAHEDIRTLVIVYRALTYTRKHDLDLLAGINGLNRRGPGKWIAYPDGEIVYTMDVISWEVELSPAMFKEYFDAALCVVASLYEPLQRVVHAGFTADEAIKYERTTKGKKKSKVERQVDSILKKALERKKDITEES